VRKETYEGVETSPWGLRQTIGEPPGEKVETLVTLEPKSITTLMHEQSERRSGHIRSKFEFNNEVFRILCTLSQSPKRMLFNFGLSYE
jgi:hypothetical protein